LSNFRFHNFELHPQERRLLADGKPCSIGSRALDVLLALVERRQRVVTKNELMDLVWPGLVVEENNLSVQISALRRLLGADAITTVTGRGYQFSAGCEDDSAAASPPPPSPLSADERQSRRLVALVCADLDPAFQAQHGPVGAAQAWLQARGSLIEHSLAAFAGHTLEANAQRTVLAFVSAVDAVAWCLDLQERLAHALPRERGPALPLRMVVMVEEVHTDQGRLVGDPFATSAAQRGFVAAGEVCVSGAVRSLVGQRIAASFVAVGGLEADYGASPVTLWRVERLRVGLPAYAAEPRLAWNRRPTLAVLPFSVGSNGDDAYFGEGITEEIITALSLNRAFFVVARGSTLKFKDAATAVERAALELGVRYIINGHVRRQGRQLRIHAELTDAQAQRVIWSDRLDGDDVDLFVFQAQIAARISAAIDPRVQEAELERVRLQPTADFGAYDCVLRGLALQFDVSAGSFEAAGSYFRRAIAIDPAYAQAHAHMARWHSLRAGDGRTTAVSADREAAEMHSQRAIALDPRDAWNLSVAGHIQAFLRKRFAVAMALFEQALAINPNCALAWARSGTTLAYTGHGEEALDRVRNAMRLSPLDQHAFYFCTTTGLAAFTLGRYDEAVAWLSRARRLNPSYRAPMRLLMAAHALAGEGSEARELARQFLSEEPGFTVSLFASWYPLQQPHLEMLLQGLRDAGVPE
jgi:adenylate cyclase